MDDFFWRLQHKLGIRKFVGFIRHLPKMWLFADRHGIMEAFPPSKAVEELVKKKYPGFHGYMSTIGDDGKPVIVIHKTITRTELEK